MYGSQVFARIRDWDGRRRGAIPFRQEIEDAQWKWHTLHLLKAAISALCDWKTTANDR